MRQAQDHHNERMRAQAGPQPGFATWVSGLPIVKTGAILLVVLVGLGVLGVIASLATLMLQGLLAAALFGGIAGALTYAAKKRAHPDTQFQMGRNDKALSMKQRATQIYSGSDPVTRAAMRVGGIVGLIALVISVLF